MQHEDTTAKPQFPSPRPDNRPDAHAKYAGGICWRCALFSISSTQRKETPASPALVLGLLLLHHLGLLLLHHLLLPAALGVGQRSEFHDE